MCYVLAEKFPPITTVNSFMNENVSGYTGNVFGYWQEIMVLFVLNYVLFE